MKSKYLILFLFLTSCSIFLPRSIAINLADYSFDYHTFNKGLDYENDVSYLLNETNYGTSLSLADNLEHVVAYFDKKLGNKVQLKTTFKDINGKLKIPFNMNYDISKAHVDFLRTITDLEYIILTKVSYLENTEKKSLNKKNTSRFIDAVSGAIFFVKIVDIQNNTTILEMSCTAVVKERDAVNMYTGEQEFEHTQIYKRSNTLGEKSMKKLLRKIK